MKYLSRRSWWVLLAALGLVPFIAFSVLKMWADGSLAQRTNAAEA